MSAADFASNPDNYCYRHPDRQSFILCQRCLRTICTECQTPGAVGVLCPECVKQSAAAVKATRPSGRLRLVRKADSMPVVTYALMAVTTLFFLIAQIPGIGRELQGALLFWGPYVLPVATPGAAFEPWRMVTVTLTHSGIFHIALNMLALWALGRSLEPLLGRIRFLALYVISAIGGSFLVALLDPLTPVVGASGAIWGLLGAMFVIGRNLGANTTGIAVILGVNLVLSFILGGVSWQGHIGGGLTGALLGLIFARTRRISQQRTQAWLLTLTGVGLAVLTAGAVYVRLMVL